MRGHAAEERHVDLGADKSLGKSLHSEDLVSPCSGTAEKRVAGRGFRGIMSHDEHILTLNVDGESLEEEMECGHEDRNGTGCRRSEDHLEPRTAQQART